MPRLTEQQKIENEERADRGGRTLAAYSSIQSENRDAEEEDEQTMVTDMLADLRHYAAREKIDFYRALATSEMHFNCERNGEG